MHLDITLDLDSEEVYIIYDDEFTIRAWLNEDNVLICTNCDKLPEEHIQAIINISESLLETLEK